MKLKSQRLLTKSTVFFCVVISLVKNGPIHPQQEGHLPQKKWPLIKLYTNFWPINHLLVGPGPTCGSHFPRANFPGLWNEGLRWAIDGHGSPLRGDGAARNTAGGFRVQRRDRIEMAVLWSMWSMWAFCFFLQCFFFDKKRQEEQTTAVLAFESFLLFLSSTLTLNLTILLKEFTPPGKNMEHFRLLWGGENRRKKKSKHRLLPPALSNERCRGKPVGALTTDQLPHPGVPRMPNQKFDRTVGRLYTPFEKSTPGTPKLVFV